MPPIPLSRRAFLTRSALIGCSAAASPLITPLSWAAAPWDTRLVVIVLRGGMDGLDLLRPYGDPDYAGLRPDLGGGPAQGAHDLDGFFALHPALERLMPLWQAGDLGFMHAVSTPYRDKRSHFDGQDILEAGLAQPAPGKGGWLNRLLQAVPGVEAQTAFALGQDDMKILAGPAPVANWTPDATLALSPQALRLAGLVMAEDPAFAQAYEEALRLSDGGLAAYEPAGIGAEPAADRAGGDAGDDRGGDRGGDGGGAPGMALPRAARGRADLRLAEFAAEQLRGDARIVSFSINGWDTHNRQAVSMTRALERFADTLLALRDGLGRKVWDRTAIVAMTEFGRTARQNGTLGTDHGTGGAMVLAGGAIAGGRVLGRWPGLSEAALYQRRDLMPTGDVRAGAAWLLRGATGLERAVLEGAVFPGLDMGDDPGLMR